MPAAKVIDFVIPSNTPEGKGKGIIVARISNAAGAVPDKLWELFSQTITKVMTATYSQVSPALIELSMENITEEDTQLVDLSNDIQSQLGQSITDLGAKVQGLGIEARPDLLGQLLVASFVGDGKRIKELLVQTFGQERVDGAGPEVKAALDALASGDAGPETKEALVKAMAALKARREANAAVKQASVKVPRDLQQEIDRIVGTEPNFTRH